MASAPMIGASWVVAWVFVALGASADHAVVHRKKKIDESVVDKSKLKYLEIEHCNVGILPNPIFRWL